LTCVFLYC